MKKMIQVLIIPLVVLSGFVFARCEIKHKTSKQSSPHPAKNESAKLVFKSTDGGQTWQDISKGLPENLGQDSIRGNNVFANDQALFVKVGSELYHSTSNATAPFWTKEISPGQHSSVAAGKSGILANKYWAVNFKKIDGTSVWSPMFENLQGPRMRSTFETAAGAIFIGTDEGIFKTDNSGETWKLVYAGGFVGHLAEANGVLLAIGMKRIIRSTDNGENWTRVVSEDSVAFDVKSISGGFAAITSNWQENTPNTSRLSTSYDGGKTWRPFDAGNKVFIDSIWRTWENRPRVQALGGLVTQVGDNFLCVHRQGIFRSSDKGKTWKLLLPSVNNKFFNLIFSGNVIYAIPSMPGKGGC